MFVIVARESDILLLEGSNNLIEIGVDAALDIDNAMRNPFTYAKSPVKGSQVKTSVKWSSGWFEKRTEN